MIRVKISTGSLFSGHEIVTFGELAIVGIVVDGALPFFGFMANAPLVRRRLVGDVLNIVGAAVAMFSGET